MSYLVKEKEKYLLFRYLRFGDRKAFGELFDAYQKPVLKFLEHKLPTTEDAQDLLSQTFLQMMEYAKTTRIDNFNALVYRIARNLTANFYKGYYQKDKKTYSFNDQILAEAEKLHNVLPEVEGVEEESPFSAFSEEQVKRYIRRLEQDDRDVVTMRFESDMSVKEIAEVIGKTENATRVMIHRALRRVRDMIYDQRSPARPQNQGGAPE